LLVLWAEGASGSAAELASLAGVGFASAYRELHAMQRLELVVSERSGHVERFKANESHPLAATLKTLVRWKAPRYAPATGSGREVRARLVSLGAPLLGEAAEATRVSPEQAVIDGVKLSHRDPAVARALPVCLFKSREALDDARLVELARQAGEKQALGFFLELTSELSGDPRFSRWAKPLRDRRVRAVHDFFDSPRSAEALALAEAKTPDAARRWRYRMNMDKETFASLYRKFVHVA
jgi:hypothetical protein